ncbi:MAG: phenylalanine--tRNA ligase subunit beta [Candidatus Bathyarchaeota archaeon]|nr:MAG: phenylalanine--tRNA ligase subunit beta [Candidatus Bathyarchaeota archaeon]
MAEEVSSTPVITLHRQRFSNYVGRETTLTEMTEWLPWLGFDIEEVSEDYVKVEFNPNRIDFSSYSGIARAFRGLRGWETGLPTYNVRDGETLLKIEDTVAEIRPFMLAAIVRGMKLNEEAVVELMEMQEDLHWGVGRDRRKASIGVHNLDAVKAPFTYTAVPPESVEFVPLNSHERMNLTEVLEKHEKGDAYRHLIDGYSKFPLLVDSDTKVLSMPPIINGELTRVDKETRNLFIDVTGTDQLAIEKSLNVLTTALADMGGSIETVEVKRSGRTRLSPDLSPQNMTLRSTYATRILGLKLSEDAVAECLEKCRLGVTQLKPGLLEVRIPPYRIDILHEVDLVEEVAIGYGYNQFTPTFPSSVTIGEEDRALKFAEAVRKIMVGLGFIEVVNFTLTNENYHFKAMCRKIEPCVKLVNPVSNEFTIMRTHLLPTLMKNLADNRHESYPQKLFEVSDVVTLNKNRETGCERRLHIASVVAHSAANFTEIKSIVEALLHNLNLEARKFYVVESPSFIEGRVAAISSNVRKQATQRSLGLVGEIHPEVLNNFNLETPVAAFELDMQDLME